MRNRSRPRVASCIVLMLLIGIGERLAAQGLDQRSWSITSRKFNWDAESRIRLAQAPADSSVMLVIATAEGQVEAVVNAIRAVGGSLRYRSDRVSYVRALVPLNAVDQLLESAPTISAEFDIADFCVGSSCLSKDDGKPAPPGPDESGAPSSPKGKRGEPVSWPALTWQQGSWKEDPFNRPYHPLADLGGLSWRISHPTYDGRGVVIGHVERRFDLLAPELQAATTLEGKPAVKVVEYVTTNLPDEVVAPARFWVQMIDVEAVNGRFMHARRTFTAPRDGRFRFGHFDGQHQQLCRAVNWSAQFIYHSGAPHEEDLSKPTCVFGVLWDRTNGDVWLDTDRDGDFAGERALRAYHMRHDVGVIGEDDPRTRGREAVSVAVQTDSATGQVAILLGTGVHATMVAGSAAASLGESGKVVGVAPGSQLMLLDSGNRSNGQNLEGIIAAFLDPRVDLVFTENNYSFRHSMRHRGGAPTTHNGQKVTTIVLSRLIAATGKPFVAPAGNSMNDAGVDVPAAGVPWGFSVGASRGRESWWINRGMRVAQEQNLYQVSNFGPGHDGSIQPAILAPSGWLTTWLSLEPANVMEEAAALGLYQPPPGYLIGGGTSQATPTFAGALALLISAAKQEGVPYDAKRIWLAVTNSASFAPHIPAYQQGHGFVDIEAAFELLKQYATRPPVVTITSRGPVRTAWSRDLNPPHQGVSLFEREGWSVGMQETRTVTLTRTSGPAGAMRFALSWQGNDGTFETPETVSLPLNRPVPLAIRVSPRETGYNSAILNLDHPSIPGHAYRLMTAVVAAEQFDETDYSITVRDTVERPGPIASYFLKLPDGVAALDVQFRGGEGDRFMLGTPHEADVWSYPCEAHCSVQTPEGGVWRLAYYLFNPASKKGVDLRWANPRDAADPPIPLEFTARLIGVDVSVAEGAVTGMENTWRATANVQNEFGAFAGALSSSALGSGRVERGRLRRLEQRVYDIAVPAGAELLEVGLPRVGVPASVDLFLLDCTNGTCDLHDGDLRGIQRAQGPTKERVFRVASPKPGRWRVVLDATHAPPEGVDYEYRDVVLDPALGGVISTDQVRERPVRAQWDANVLIWRSDAPLPEGRVPYISLIVEAVMSNGERIPAGVLVKDLAELTSHSEVDAGRVHQPPSA